MPSQEERLDRRWRRNNPWKAHFPRIATALIKIASVFRRTPSRSGTADVTISTTIFVICETDNIRRQAALPINTHGESPCEDVDPTYTNNGPIYTNTGPGRISEAEIIREKELLRQQITPADANQIRRTQAQYENSGRNYWPLTTSPTLSAPPLIQPGERNIATINHCRLEEHIIETHSRRPSGDVTTSSLPPNLASEISINGSHQTTLDFPCMQTLTKVPFFKQETLRSL